MHRARLRPDASELRRARPAALFFYDEQKVERISGVIDDNVIFMPDVSDKSFIAGLKFIPVPAVKYFIRDPENRSRQIVLKIKNVKAGEASNRFLILLVILHHFFISRDSCHIY